MKVSICIFSTLILCCSCSAENTDDLRQARIRGAEAKITLVCVDQDGNPVSNAVVSTALYPDGSFKNAIVANGHTDKSATIWRQMTWWSHTARARPPISA